MLAAGHRSPWPVTVTKHGTTPESYLRRRTARPEHDGESDPERRPPRCRSPLTGTPPEFIVPSHYDVDHRQCLGLGSVGIFFDYSWAFGDPDLMADTQPFGEQSERDVDVDGVADGTVDNHAVPRRSGRHGVPPCRNHPDADDGHHGRLRPGCSTAVGDPVARERECQRHVHPVVVDPGQTVTIPVTITPGGTMRTTVRGRSTSTTLADQRGRHGEAFERCVPEGATWPPSATRTPSS